MIDHIYLPVSDLKRSSEFYKKMLEPLGIDMPYKFDRLRFRHQWRAGFLAEEWRSRQRPLRRIHRQERGRRQASYKAAIDAELLQTRNRAFGPNGVLTTSRQTSATGTDTTSRLPISLGFTNKNGHLPI